MTFLRFGHVACPAVVGIVVFLDRPIMAELQVRVNKRDNSKIHVAIL